METLKQAMKRTAIKNASEAVKASQTRAFIIWLAYIILVFVGAIWGAGVALAILVFYPLTLGSYAFADIEAKKEILEDTIKSK